eukprot:TRINITY_DN63800_c0_g2_i1.p1 TRINITY_DN63800_c0_g2~~TRINITY_DN63800_c0_g2_i1.p1  ORF type:complete len:141 (+),score=15.79 TRINITY_DN63800_c0_g2_i1:187-609(+)
MGAQGFRSVPPRSVPPEAPSSMSFLTCSRCRNTGERDVSMKNDINHVASKDARAVPHRGDSIEDYEPKTLVVERGDHCECSLISPRSRAAGGVCLHCLSEPPQEAPPHKEGLTGARKAMMPEADAPAADPLPPLPLKRDI